MTNVEIIDLDALVPPDIDFKYRGEVFHLPGDVDVGYVLTLYRVMIAFNEEGDDSEAEDIERTVDAARRALLPLFQAGNPGRFEKTDDLPFGARSLGVIIRKVLERVAFLVQDDEAIVPPTPRKPAARSSTKKTSTGQRTRTATTSRKKRSARSGSSTA